MAKEKGRREPDYSVSWYCYFRLREKLDAGVSQARIALDSNNTTAAISNLMSKVEGIGPTTTARFAKYFGFPTRGALIDAADVWWNAEGSRLAMGEQRRLAEEKSRKLAADAARAARRERDETEAKKKARPRHEKKKAG